MSALRTLELHLRGAAQVEFEIRDGEMSLLSARKVERPAPRTAVRLAVELAEAGAVDDATAVAVDPRVGSGESVAPPATAHWSGDSSSAAVFRHPWVPPSGASR